MALTDAALRVLLVDYRNARTARDAAEVTLEAAELALAQGLGAGGECIVAGRKVRVLSDGLHVTVEPVRVVA